jgi:hypothetical protein
MFILLSLAVTLFVVFLYAIMNNEFSLKAVPAYVPQSIIPRKKTKKLNSYLPTYNI